MRYTRLAALLAVTWPGQAQLAPVVAPRGVVNAFTQQPAPSSVAPGGLIWINGLNLGSASETKVYVNGAEAVVLSASATRITAQIPAGTALGLAEVVVERGGARSRAAKVVVERAVPSVRTSADSGYGEAHSTSAGGRMVFTASGLAVADGQPQTAVAHVGGLLSEVELAAREGRAGEFEVKVKPPDGWQAGEVLSLRQGAQLANRTTVGKLSRPQLSFVKLAADAAELRSLTGADLRGIYLIASAAKDSEGCYPSFLIDFSKNAAGRIGACLASASQNALSPVAAESEGSGLGALLGPAEGQGSAGVSSKAVIFHPERTEPMTVTLPSAATSLVGMGVGGLTAILAGEQARRVEIDTRTGEVRDSEGAPGLAGPAGGGMPVDLGDGMTQVISAPVTAADGSTGMVVADQAEEPTRMKFAIVSPQREVTSLSFPENWVALLGASGGAPAAGGAGGGGGLNAMRAAVVYHAASGWFVVLAKNASSAHGLVAFRKDQGARLTRFPDGWYAATCTARPGLYSFDLSSTLMAPASTAVETGIKNPCLATGLVVATPGAETASAMALPAQAPFVAGSASAGAMNDFVYSVNGATPDSLVVFDGAAGTASQLSLPVGVTSFSGVTAIPLMNAVVATATYQTAGDAGFVLFELEKGEARGMNLPEGFSSATLAGVFPITRKLVAVGVRSNNAGSQYIVYDLVSGDATVVANPDGVAYVGTPPQQTAAQGGGGTPPVGGGTPPVGGGTPPVGGGTPPAGGGMPTGGGTATPGTGPGLATGGLQEVNTKANTIVAVAFDADRKQAGVVALRVP